MKSSLIFYAVNPEISESLELKSQTLQVKHFGRERDLPQFLDYLQQTNDEVCAVILGPELTDPIQMIQRIHSVDPRISVIVLGAASNLDQLKRALQFAPSVGDQVNCIHEGSRAVIEKEVVRAIEQTERRRKYLTLVSSANETIGKLSHQRPPSRNEDLFARLPDFAPIGIAALNNEFEIVAWNLKAARMTGQNEREVLGKPLWEVFSGTDEGQIRSRLEVRSNFEKPNPLVIEAGGPEGEERVFELICGPLSGREMRGGSMAILQDITDRIQKEREIKEAQRQADAANIAKSNFLANMSHEIRTPLGAVMGFVELMKSESLSKNELKEYISVIERNSTQLLRIIDDILDLSKIEAGKMLIEHIDFSLPEMLADFGSLMNLRAREKGIRFRTSAEGFSPTMVNSDPTRIRQILTNIVGNSIKFTDQGEVQLLVTFTGNHLKFTVRDTGRGISSEQAKNLFRPFTQADTSTTRQFGGTGLGLHLTRRLAETMGGEFYLAESELGQGSTFVATVQVRTPAAAQVIEASRTNPQQEQEGLSFNSAAEPDLSPMKVLLVEDSPDNQALVKIVLERMGVHLSIAPDGSEGVKCAQKENFDLILMDIQMPNMDGHEATRTLRKMGYSKPIVAFTAHAMKEERERVAHSGFDGFLSKPISQKDLLHTLQKYRPSAPASEPVK